PSALPGVLYGEGRNSLGTQVLLTINTATGQGTAVGPLGVAPNANFQDISFRHSDGKLFGYFSGNSYTSSTTTGQATSVGKANDFSLGGNALAFSPNDVLLSANNVDLQTVNQTTGLATHLLNLTYSPTSGTPRANGMDFDPLTGVLFASVVYGNGLG